MIKFIFRYFFKRKKAESKKIKIFDSVTFVKSSDPKQAMIDWVEEYLIDSGINLENVYVQDINQNGLCIYTKKPNSHIKINNIKYSNIYKKNEYSLLLPYIDKNVDDLTFFYNLSVWLHEIAHYIFKHNSDVITSIIIQEYEACLYAEKQLERMPIYIKSLSQYKSISNDLYKSYINIRDICLSHIKSTNSLYVKQYYEKNYNRFIPSEVRSYVKREYRYKSRYEE